MTEIIIIEDDDSDYKRLLECIENFGRESGEQLNVKRYVSALQFLDGYKTESFCGYFVCRQAPLLYHRRIFLFVGLCYFEPPIYTVVFFNKKNATLTDCVFDFFSKNLIVI